MGRFFDQDGPLIGAMNTITAIVGLNLLTVFFSIPIVTAGAAFATMHYIIMQYRQGIEGKMIPTFWKQFKGNLKTATPFWLILLIFSIFIYADYRLVAANKDLIPTRFIVPIAVMGALMASVTMFAFPLLGKFENTTRATIKNAAILAVANFPRTLTMIVIHLVCLFLFTQVVQLWPLSILMGISLPAWLCSLLYWPIIKKLIPEEPEDDYYGTSDDTESAESPPEEPESAANE